jgi:concentrative nucleoside transporter, CNT family
VIKWTIGQQIFHALGQGATWLLDFSYYGSSFIFGDLGQKDSPRGFIFAFQALPIIIFIAAFFALLYYWGIMQLIVKAAARVMTRLMGASGAESLNVAASIFMGQTEAPLTIRPFLPGATRSELMTIMTSGMAHVSGGIMAAYILYGINASSLLAAVIMTAPGTILIAKMLVPETEQPATEGVVRIPESEEHKDENLIGSIARGTLDGGRLAMNVGIMLISFLALIALLNLILGGLHAWLGIHHIPFPHSLDTILGFLFAPIAWLIGIPWHDAPTVGNLLGTRMVLNELVAYTYLGNYARTGMLAARSVTIATFALCGFANLSSIGIQIGGIGALAPNRRNELAKLGLRAMLAGTMANLMSASIVSILIR